MAETNWSAGKECLKHKKLYLAVCLISILLASVIYISIPDEYYATEEMADEPKETDILLGLNSITAMIRQHITSNEPMGDYEIYPQMVNTPEFVRDAGKIKVEGYDCDYYTYLKENHKYPWWYYIAKIFSSQNEQAEIEEVIKDNIKYEIDITYHTVSLQVRDNDPLVAVMMLDSITDLLHKYMVRGNTKKLKADLANAANTRLMRGKRYKEAQARYAAYSDDHYNPVTEEEKTTLQSLQQERDKAFEAYNTASIQYERQKALAGKKLAGFAVYRKPVVPLDPSSPKLIGYLLGIMITTLIFTTWWILFRRSYYEYCRSRQETED